jgi:hypothetical protein
MNTFFNNTIPKNFETDWLPTDSYENFKNNIKKHPKTIKSLGWTKNSICYKIDKYGFRNDFEFTDQYYNLALGCSITFGIGVNEKDIWYNFLKKQFDEPFFNAGIPGGNIGGCYRSLVGLLNQGLKVKRVFMFIPAKNRYEIFDTSESKWRSVAWWSDHPDIVKKYLLTDETIDNFYQTNLLSIHHICEKNNIEIVALDSGDHTQIEICQKGRDLRHPGIATHTLIGEVFYNEYCQRHNSRN